MARRLRTAALVALAVASRERRTGARFPLPGPIRRRSSPRLARPTRDWTRERFLAWGFTRLNAIFPKLPGKLVVHSLPDLEDGALAVLEELHRRGYSPIVLLEEAASVSLLRNYTQKPVRAYPKNSFRGRYHFLTAGGVITTHVVFRSHRPPRTQTVVSVWHGELTKPIGRMIGEFPPRSTWATALSKIGKAFRCAEFDIAPGQVLVVGAPRNDRLLRTDRAAVRSAISGVRTERPLFLWLPTYRAARRTGRVDGEAHAGLVPLDDRSLEALDSWLDERGATLLAKPHPLARDPGQGRHRRIRRIDALWLAERRITLYNLLAAVDCLITDASTVWVDFLLTDRPIIFAFPDLDSYRRTRGLNLEPYELWAPGRFVATGEQLIEEMERVITGKDGYEGARREAKLRLHTHLDDRSTVRLLDALGL